MAFWLVAYTRRAAWLLVLRIYCHLVCIWRLAMTDNDTPMDELLNKVFGEFMKRKAEKEKANDQ